jgi:uncharacterized protein
MVGELSVPLEVARRVAVLKQELAGEFPSASPDAVLDVARKIRCIQVDPINAVARTQHLVLFSRLGPGYRAAHLDEVAWQRKELFSYWAHAASFVLTEDFPIHALRMRRWATDDSVYSVRAREWIQDNARMKRHVLARIRKEGPLRSRDFTVPGAVPWQSGGWNAGQDVSRILEFLWTKGKVMIAGRRGLDRLWDLSERWFPDWTPRDRLTDRQVVERAALHSLRALGVATPRQIAQHFTRSSYPGLAAAIDRLRKKGEIVPVTVGEFPRPWLTTAEDAERLGDGLDFEPRTTLLSPFDNLIADRARTRDIFDFDYTIEIYVPKAKRRFGYYVLPILHGDRLIGRIDSRMDRENGLYVVEHIYAEDGAPRDRSTGRAVRGAIESLAAWLGATSIRFGTADAWKTVMR